ncbi:MAG: AAA family ATPase [Eubacteriales bacterium]|nr:AAA family ATPase [Eubacteriales bacterium]
MVNQNEILGNESIKNYFHAAMEHQRVSHAYILEGEKGCGKKTIAAMYAKSLQCEAESGKPCGKCTSCLQTESRNHPDIIWVQHEKPNIISVGEIREQVINTIDVKPYRGPYKIYIIDEAEKMNDSAQNAILKTIEEPTEYAIIFLLTTSRGAFLPTILSRCILLSIKPLTTSLIRSYLMQKLSVDEGLADFYAGFSMGNLGKAINIASSEEFNEMRGHALHLLKGIHELENNELDEQVKQCKAYKDRISDYFDMMRMWFRDLLILKTTKEREKLIFHTSIVELSKQSAMLRLDAIDKIFGLIDQAERQIRSYVNFEAAMDVMLQEMKACYQHR